MFEIFVNKINIVEKKKEKLRKKQLLIARKLRLTLHRFLDPYTNHRIYGDIVFTDKLMDSSKNEIYSFELYRDYKAIRQIHVREYGVIIELEDFNEKELSSTGLIKSRLKSLGDKQAFDMAEILDNYQDFFLTQITNYKKIHDIIQIYGGKSLKWIDDIFSLHKDDLIFIRGSKIINSIDFRTVYLCYNFSLLEWITEENNYFSENFISDCFKIWPLEYFDEILYLMKIIMNKTEVLPYKKLHTIIGNIQINISVKLKVIPEERILFHYMILDKKNVDEKFLESLKKVKISDDLKKQKNEECERAHSMKYSNLIKLYYLNRNNEKKTN